MIDFRFTTIFGANLGFEILDRNNFESAGLDVEWAFMLNLLFVRITMTKYPEE